MCQIVTVFALMGLLGQIASDADRSAQFEKLQSEYDLAEKEFDELPQPQQETAAEKIRGQEAWPGWQFFPRFVELAQAQPNDETAFRSCQWIFGRMPSVGNWDKIAFEADQSAWDILAAHHTNRADLPKMCFEAVLYIGPAQEKFLRGLLARKDLSRDNMGFATTALAELLAHKFSYLESVQTEQHLEPLDDFGEYMKRRKSADWGKDLVSANAAKFKTESIALFRDVLDRYSDVPVTISTPYFRDLSFLGEKATKSLHALEHLTIGSEAPNIVGKDLQGEPLDLHSYRGRVVVLSFWFTGCGPCMGMVPQEQHLIETYQGRPFALLGVCKDESLEEARQTAAEHKMNWPCWFDGQKGPIVDDWNVLGWPTIYILDEQGVISAKNLRGKELDAKIAEMMAGK